MDIPVYLKSALHSALLESSRFMSKNPYLTPREHAGDFYTRLNRNLKLTPIGCSLSVDNIAHMSGIRGEGISSLTIVKLKYSSAQQDLLVEQLQHLVSKTDFSLINLEAKFTTITEEISNYKITA